MDQQDSPPNSNPEDEGSQSSNNSIHSGSGSDTSSRDRSSPDSIVSEGNLPSPVFKDGARFEFIHPRIPTPEIPSTTVQEDVLRELAEKDAEHAEHKICDEFLEYQMKRKIAKRALLRYQHRLTALSDVMTVIDIPQDKFDLISPNFRAPPPVPEKLSYDQFKDEYQQKLETARSLVRMNTGVTADEFEPIGKDNQPDNATSQQPNVQDDEVKIMTYRINKLSTIYPQ
jgi:hypothetical protein